ncbi:helix-turn-helix transcriptional regulator [Pararhizobium sp. PWRC1-1]|uniref:helix-turn-helix transcriptional regulator n=1 Tax=Pararhizobium sp. PWRC1-1 TaxID=2804566 RepID=UPI003CF9A6F8
MDDRIGFYTFADLCRILRLSKKTIYRYLERLPGFPKPVKYWPDGDDRWFIPDVHEWIRKIVLKR